MTRRLIALSGPLAGSVFPLDKDVTTLGRDPENDIVLDAPWVSRQHCELRRTSDGLELLDKKSHNGTTVNGVPVTERWLKVGDRIALGGASFVLADSEELPTMRLELDDEPLPAGATVELRVAEASQSEPEGLRVLLSMVRLLGAAEDEALAEKLLDRFFDVLPAERGAIVLGASLEEVESAAARPGRFAVSRTVLTKVLNERTAVLSNRVAEDLREGKSLLRSGVTALACLPLVAGDRVVGAAYLDSRDPAAEFPERKLELVVGLAGVAASALEKARQLGRLRAENRRLLEESDLVHDMVGESPRLRDAQKILARAAPTDATVLIGGESGTGKELAARALHLTSPRRDRPLVKVDCTGLQENLLASELFGHERGAFTGALQQKKGKLELADGGTVFLDEVGELPLGIQAQLLRVLQDREFERVGGTRPIAVDIRLVAATHRNLSEEVEAGRFREDLFYRLNVVTLELPPLRERASDVELLARYFVAHFSRKVKRPVVGLSPEALDVLKRYSWPGNIRELANTIERAVVLGTTELVLPDDLPETLRETPRRSDKGQSGATSYHEAVVERKVELILDAVSRSGGSITEAARLLELHPNYLHRLIRNLGLRDALKQS